MSPKLLPTPNPSITLVVIGTNVPKYMPVLYGYGPMLDYPVRNLQRAIEEAESILCRLDTNLRASLRRKGGGWEPRPPPLSSIDPSFYEGRDESYFAEYTQEMNHV